MGRDSIETVSTPSRSSKHEAGFLGQYDYAPLHGSEIRLLQLAPGRFDDDISFTLHHEALCAPEIEKTSTRLTKRDVQATLSKGWRAFKTPEGRWFYLNTKTHKTTYNHPVRERLTHLESQIEVDGFATGSAPRFEALSYVWGDSLQRGRARVTTGSSGGGAGYLHLRQNLITVLKYLRHVSEPRVLWIDAVCINQEDLGERQAQVSRMHEIYSLAWRVTVWLGEGNERSALALDTLRYLGRQIEISNDRWRLAAPDAQEPDWVEADHPLPYTNTQWSALEDLFRRPWFDRVWVVQEVALANVRAMIQCGDAAILFSDLRRAMAALEGKLGVPTALVRCIDKHCTLAYGFDSSTVTSKIWLSRHRESSDPRDKVYGMLGLLGPAIRRDVRPSYEQTVEDTYQKIFLSHSRISQRLDLLTQCFSENKGLDLPSWVPDWKQYPSVFENAKVGYQAAGMSKGVFRQIETGVLEVQGVACGSVATVQGPAIEDDDGSLINELRRSQPKKIAHATYVTGETMDDAWLRTVSLDTLEERFPSDDNATLNEWRALMQDVCGPQENFEQSFWRKILKRLWDKACGCFSSSQGLTGVQKSGLEKMPRWTRDTMENQRFFNTDTSYFGFGTMDIRKGDRIYVVLGVFTPLVLRPTKDGHLRVVGWCYVHGLMDSEALLGYLPPGWEARQHFVNRRYTPRYRNKTTRRIQKDDPRLGPVGNEWERVDSELTADDPINVDCFRNTGTGEIINHDPRLLPDALKLRGVRLEILRLT